MSKIYEALLHARSEQNLNRGQTQNLDNELKAILRTSKLPPLRMESEMRRLYQNLSGLLTNQRKNVVQFIASRKSEGTSTILREFSKYIVEKGNKSVLLISADPLDVSHYQAYGLSPTNSIQYVQSIGGSLDQGITQVKHSRLFLCRLYPKATSDSRSEVREIIPEIWKKIRLGFDFILIDSSPLSTADIGLSLCSSTDGVVLVLEAEKTRSQVVLNTKQRIIESGGNLLGIVFNKQHHYIPNWIYKML